MAWQKGPGEGFHAAKADALAINSKLRCRSVGRAAYDGAPWKRYGFIVVDQNDKQIGRGAMQARDAWANAFFALGGRYKGGRAILPRRRQ